MTTPVVTWPPSHEQHQHLAVLAQLIQRHGRERFLDAPLVCANERDFPERWEPSLTGVHRVLYRLAWLAHWDTEISIVDARPAAPPDHRMLQSSEVELAGIDKGVASFAVAAIGNDDVAGLLSHRLGLAFVEGALDTPYRGTTTEATETTGSIAAIYLGLGVLVANSSMYRRYSSRMIAREVVEEQQIAKVGGLSITDATFLLAVQDILRDEASQDALATLLPPQAEWLAKWRDVLDPHEDELRDQLGIDDVEPRTLSRPAKPRTPPAAEERNTRHFNAGRTTFRVPNRAHWPMLVGGAAGAFGFLLPFGLFVAPALMLAGALVGRTQIRTHYTCADTSCGWYMPNIVGTCPGCGGTIAETIAHADMRLERLEALGLRDDDDDHHGDDDSDGDHHEEARV